MSLRGTQYLKINNQFYLYLFTIILKLSAKVLLFFDICK